MLLKDIINPKKWVDYVTFLFRKFFGLVAERFGYNTPQDLYWKSEVIEYRKLICDQCAKAGKCIVPAEGETEACGCDFIGKATDMSLSCSNDYWKAVDSYEEWEKQKEKYYSNFKIGFIQNEVK
ncbi:MAG: hypothetical protein KBH21_00105 [Acetoanaerobium sp.]|nr:hypothetical protein [Acetoanaerobium sp.]